MASPTVLGFWHIYARLRSISVADPAKEAVLTKLLNCRKDLGRCLAVISVIVSVATGALRKALLAHGWVEKQFPAANVLLYGASFTLVLLSIYVPAFLTWRSKSLAFIDDRYAPPDEAWAAGRTRLVEPLGTDLTVSTNLTAAFGIVAPLATSALSLLVPGLSSS